MLKNNNELRFGIVNFKLFHLGEVDAVPNNLLSGFVISVRIGREDTVPLEKACRTVISASFQIIIELFFMATDP